MQFVLTAVEKFDLQHPGFADDVRQWLAQGISAAKIEPLLSAKYQIPIPPGIVGRFRTRCWVPEQRLLREKRLAALAEEQVAQELAIKAELAQEARGEHQ